MTLVDWTIVRTGATAGLLVIIPGALLADRLTQGRQVGSWTWVFLAMALLAFGLAGLVAGRLRSDTPMLHGALGAGVAFAVAQLFGILVTISRGNSINWVAVGLTALLAITVGIAGSLIGDRLHRRSVAARSAGA